METLGADAGRNRRGGVAYAPVDSGSQGGFLPATRASASRLGGAFPPLDRGGQVVDGLVLADMAVGGALGICGTRVGDILPVTDLLDSLARFVGAQRHIIDLAADRGAFICQSQSMNIYLRDASLAKLTSMHFYGWKKGLKTGSYYIRQTAARQAQKVTVDASVERAQAHRRQAEALLLSTKTATPADLAPLSDEEVLAWAQGTCSAADPEGCLMCSG